MQNIFSFKFGTIFSTAISGLLLQHFDGYGSVFYFFGTLGVIWFIIFVSRTFILCAKYRVLYILNCFIIPVNRLWSATTIPIRIPSSATRKKSTSKSNWDNWSVTRNCPLHHGLPS